MEKFFKKFNSIFFRHSKFFLVILPKILGKITEFSGWFHMARKDPPPLLLLLVLSKLLIMTKFFCKIFQILSLFQEKLIILKNFNNFLIFLQKFFFLSKKCILKSNHHQNYLKKIFVVFFLSKSKYFSSLFIFFCFNCAINLQKSKKKSRKK